MATSPVVAGVAGVLLRRDLPGRERAVAARLHAVRRLHGAVASASSRHRRETIVRSDLNAWGRVLHVARLGPDWPEALRGEVYRYDLVQAWAYQSPGWGWEAPAATVPTVFHPVEARGNTLLVAGLPAAPRAIHGSDGGQDRPACVAA